MDQKLDCVSYKERQGADFSARANFSAAKAIFVRCHVDCVTHQSGVFCMTLGSNSQKAIIIPSRHIITHTESETNIPILSRTIAFCRGPCNHRSPDYDGAILWKMNLRVLKERQFIFLY